MAKHWKISRLPWGGGLCYVRQIQAPQRDRNVISILAQFIEYGRKRIIVV